MATGFYRGQRLSFDRDLCTVRYVGQVEGTKGEWLGVEWDDPARGKHDGSHKGVRYFQCRREYPTAGSFLRPNRPCDPPLSYVEALKRKYASEIVTDARYSHIDKTVAGKAITISGKEVEEVGFDDIRRKLADLEQLRIVILDTMCIATPYSDRSDQCHATTASGQLTDVNHVSPKVQELDLSRNLFEEWGEVASICVQLQNLRRLRVDGNRLRDIQLHATLSSAFAQITILGLDNTLLAWDEIMSICSAFPMLQSLSLANNALSSLGQSLLPLTVIEVSLEGNYFRSLDSLRCLKGLPKLRSLRLKSNLISTSSSVGVQGAESLVFPDSVVEVDLAHNCIDDWGFIEHLKFVFPGLISLRISNNPLYHLLQAADGQPLTADDGYLLTVGRLGTLGSINFSTISAKERLNAETYYLSQIAAELSRAAEGQRPGIVAKHGQYQELCARYGVPEIANSHAGAVEANTLAARLINFTFYPGDSLIAALDASGKPALEFSVELPRTLAIYSILGVVGKRLETAPLKLRLFWETGDWALAGNRVEPDMEEWDSSEDEDEDGSRTSTGQPLVREVEWVAGTRQVGTWVEATAARVRVEFNQGSTSGGAQQARADRAAC